MDIETARALAPELEHYHPFVLYDMFGPEIAEVILKDHIERNVEKRLAEFLGNTPPAD